MNSEEFKCKGDGHPEKLFGRLDDYMLPLTEDGEMQAVFPVGGLPVIFQVITDRVVLICAECGKFVAVLGIDHTVYSEIEQRQALKEVYDD